MVTWIDRSEGPRMVARRADKVGVVENKNRRLVALCVALSLSIALYLAATLRNRLVSNSPALPSTPSPSLRLPGAAVPVVHEFRGKADAELISGLGRNPFVYADEPPKLELPPPALAPPPPPPPPPAIRPDARFVGTVYTNETMVVFSAKTDLLMLREGDILEQRYIVKHISPETVVLEDSTYHHTSTMTLAKK